MAMNTTLQNALPIVAAAYGRRFGVKVHISGDVAYTDGKSIVLPNIPESYPHKDALWGYLAHEAAHVRFTDFSIDMGEGTVKSLFNIIEDARIEREMIAVYPGVAMTLNEVARYMAQAGHYEVPKETSPAPFVLEAFCLYYLQYRVVGQDAIESVLAQTRSVFEQVFPKGVQVRLRALLRKVAGLKSSIEARSLVDEIMKMIQEEAEKKTPPPPPQSQSSSSSTGQDQNPPAGGGDQQGGSNDQGQPSGDAAKDANSPACGNKAEGEGSDQSQSANGQKGGHQDASQSSSGNDAKDAGKDQGQSSQGIGAGAGDGDKAAALQHVLAGGNGEDDHIKDPYASLRDEMDSQALADGNPHYRTVREAQDVLSNEAAGKVIRDEVNATTSRIRSQLAGLVQASQQRNTRMARRGKRLDHKQLHRLQTGDTRVFRREAPKQRPNTAVHLLIDMSSSMKNTLADGKPMYRVAREAAMAIGLALESIQGVNPAVTFFGSNTTHPVFSAVRHGQSVKRNAGRFVMAPVGNTPMAEAIWYSGFELVQTREARKMLIVVTDGQPGNASATVNVAKLCESSNVEVIGIGVGTNSVASLFSNHIVINDVTDLQTTLFKLMELSLTASAA